MCSHLAHAGLRRGGVFVKLNFLIAVVALVPLQAAAQQVPASVAPGQIEKQFEEPFEARAADEHVLALLDAGRHDAVIDGMPAYRTHGPEAFFGHYLMMVGALGGRRCTARGERFSAYESAAGTGQVHVWFDLPHGQAA